MKLLRHKWKKKSTQGIQKSAVPLSISTRSTKGGLIQQVEGPEEFSQGHEVHAIPAANQQGKPVSQATVREGNDKFSMLAEGYVSSELESKGEGIPEDLDGNHNINDSMDCSDEETDSVKMLPISQEDRLRQMEEIDIEMTEKLMELRDIMASGGLTRSTKFIQENFLRPELGMSGETPKKVH